MVKNQCLEIKIGDEYLSKVESIENFEQSFFSEVYFKAFKSVEEIVKNNTEKEKIINYENYNNVIAFTGERGTGKTSTMLSVSKVLKNNKYNEFTEELNEELNKYKFIGLDVIDPSHFQKNSNIIKIILAKMFQNFKKEVDKGSNQNNNKKREVLKNFENVSKDIKIIEKDGSVEGETIDDLLKMSASSDLKGHLEKLIELYLDFMDSAKNKKILVIEIDDLDLNTKHSYEMIEQIRKYLIIKNVVILMAVKIEQLSLVIERNTRLEFKELINAGQIGNDRLKAMVDKYLKKLIPLERRLYMPELEIESENKKIKIIKNDKNGEDKEEIIDEKVRSLIYHKTGMEFIDGKYIVPNNLRDLINIISLLEKMPDLTDEEKKKKTMTNNFLLWKEYIFEIWMKKYLSNDQQEILGELYKREIEEKNKYIVNEIENIYDLLKKDDKFKERRESEKYIEIEEEYQDIINLNNNPKNICLGDVLLVLDKAKKYKIGIQDQRFIYAVKMVYSIMLSEIYEVSEKDLKDNYIERNDYQKLIGGYLYNIKNQKFMRKSRDRMIISIAEIRKIISELKSDSEIKEENIWEFFNIFSVKVNKFYNQGKRKREIRQNKELIYKNSFKEKDENEGKIEVDIFGFLYNIKPKEFYIKNIEVLENIFSGNYKGSSSKYSDQLKTFINEYIRIIRMKHNYMIKEEDTVSTIDKFIKKINKDKDIKFAFDKLMTPEKLRELKKKMDDLIEAVNKKDEGKCVLKNAIKSLIDKIKALILNEINKNEDDETIYQILSEIYIKINYSLNINDFIKYSDDSGNENETVKKYGKKSEVRSKVIGIIKECLDAEENK